MRNHTHPEEIILRTLAAARISEEVGIFLGDGHIMLRECFCVKPSLIPFSGMEVHENFLLIFGRDLLPPSNFLLWKQKKVQYFFDKSKGNKSPFWKPSLQ